MSAKRYLSHYRCVTIVAMVTKLHQNDTTSCYGKRYVGDSDKRYRYDAETMEYFLPGSCVANNTSQLVVYQN